ncbi:MAG: 6-carboxytetrahydropterin synthase [Fimbriimonadaceae bacterium]|jgi:6-pyruvoyltetrahydropterin/6-carboxytetrahydropterin synthase|nr:6-carboxytetrahydropterin synthase [Fimbriimonadaceae bacterium]
MVVAISKEFRFEMGHRLPYHQGGCQNIHGHSYILEVGIRGHVSEKGMVMDYSHLSRLVKPLIEELDHSFMVDDQDKLVLDFLESQGLKKVVVPFYTTAENIAFYLAELLKPELEQHKNLSSFWVTLHETRTSTATLEVSL